MVPNIGPICILFLVWVCRNDGKEDIKNVSCIDPDIEEGNLTCSGILRIALQYDVHVHVLLLHVPFDVSNQILQIMCCIYGYKS
jgi:hypothetical protein